MASNSNNIPNMNQGIVETVRDIILKFQKLEDKTICAEEIIQLVVPKSSPTSPKNGTSLQASAIQSRQQLWHTEDPATDDSPCPLQESSLNVAPSVGGTRKRVQRGTLHSLETAGRLKKKPRLEDSTAYTVARVGVSDSDTVNGNSSADDSSTEDSTDYVFYRPSETTAPGGGGLPFQWMKRSITLDRVDRDGLAVFEWATKKGIVLAVYYCPGKGCGQPFVKFSLQLSNQCCHHSESCLVRARPQTGEAFKTKVASNFCYVIPNDFSSLLTEDSIQRWEADVKEHMRANGKPVKLLEKLTVKTLKNRTLAYSCPILKSEVRQILSDKNHQTTSEGIGNGMEYEEAPRSPLPDDDEETSETGRSDEEYVQPPSPTYLSGSDTKESMVIIVVDSSSPPISPCPKDLSTDQSSECTPGPSMALSQQAVDTSISGHSFNDTGSPIQDSSCHGVDVQTLHGTTIRTSPSDSRTSDTDKSKFLDTIRKCIFNGVTSHWAMQYERQKPPADSYWENDRRCDPLDLLMRLRPGEGKMSTRHSYSLDDVHKVDAWIDSLARLFLVDETKPSLSFQTPKNERHPRGHQGLLQNFIVFGMKKGGRNATKFYGTIYGLKRKALDLKRHQRSSCADFVHAYTLKDLKMEIWIIDRSGNLYSSGSFHVHHEMEKFACAMVGYATVRRTNGGLDKLYKRDDESSLDGMFELSEYCKWLLFCGNSPRSNFQ